MRVALDTDDIDLQSLPRFQRASRYQRILLQLALLVFIVALAMGVVWWWLPASIWRPLLAGNSAALAVLCAGLQAAYWVARWRSHALDQALGSAVTPDATKTAPQDSVATVPTGPLKRWLRKCSTWRDRVAQAVRRHGSAEGWAALCMGVLTLAALLLVINTWDLRLPPVALDVTAMTAAACAVLLAFGLLVLERYCAGKPVVEFPEAAQLAPLARVAITVSLLTTGCVLLSNGSRQWPTQVAVLIGLLPMVVAMELLLRALLSTFAPRNPRLEPEMLADSILAGLWRWPLRPLQNLQDELKQRFGIDLRQSWAFAYIRRALLPVLSVIAMIAWLLSGIAEIPIDARGIYERFGKPVAVLGPGLHAGLPWPMARVRLLENGVVHELATASAVEDANEQTQANADIELATAEGPPPRSANRLWDASHVAEKSQVIASLATTNMATTNMATTGTATARQSFHVVNMDVRFMYRIGLSDAAALAATYNSTDVPTLIRSTANRILVSYFASRTLEGVLGETRIQLARDIGAQVQADLDALNSGVEILATVIEAIHPPAAAANAYHSVQAAQITAQAIIARERGNAAEQINLAHLRAGMARDKATGVARETLATAEAAQLSFAAERNAYRTAGKAFLLERYFGQLTQGLANAQLVIVDHRLRGASSTIDLRNFAAPVDAKRVEQ